MIAEAESGMQTRILQPVTLKIGALAIAAGDILLVALSFLHPHLQDPNNLPAVFSEYAASQNWILIHVGQLLAYALVYPVGILVIYDLLAGEKGASAWLARLAVALAVINLAVFTVDQAVDGIALKRTVDQWASAAPDAKAIAFGLVQSIRWVEFGLNGLLKFSEGALVLVISTAMLLSQPFPKWVGAAGAISGAGQSAVGIATLFTGFSALVGTINLVPFLAGLVWTVAVIAILWRKSTTF
jgi:hypothetical protein